MYIILQAIFENCVLFPSQQTRTWDSQIFKTLKMYGISKCSASLKLRWKVSTSEIMYKKKTKMKQRRIMADQHSRTDKIIIICTNAINLNFTLCYCYCPVYSLIACLLLRSSVKIRKKEGWAGTQRSYQHNILSQICN